MPYWASLASYKIGITTFKRKSFISYVGLQHCSSGASGTHFIDRTSYLCE